MINLYDNDAYRFVEYNNGNEYSREYKPSKL